MKKTSVYLILCIAAGGLLFASAPACAEEKGGWASPEAKAKMEQAIAEGEKAAGISQEQRAKIKALREEFRSQQKALWDKIKAKREALRKELDSPSPDRGRAEAIAKDMNALQGQAAMNRIDEVFKVRAILTPEQYQKLRAFHEKNKDKFREKMKGRRKDGKGPRAGGSGPWHEKDGMPGGEGDE